MLKRVILRPESGESLTVYSSIIIVFLLFFHCTVDKKVFFLILLKNIEDVFFMKKIKTSVFSFFTVSWRCFLCKRKLCKTAVYVCFFLTFALLHYKMIIG